MVDLKQKSLLVVGGTGFIGTVLLKRANILGLKTTSLSLNKPSYTNALDNTKYLGVYESHQDYGTLRRID